MNKKDIVKRKFTQNQLQRNNIRNRNKEYIQKYKKTNTKTLIKINNYIYSKIIINKKDIVERKFMRNQL